MSIATKTGDHGMTGLMFNRRVPKTHARVEAYGNVDELNAAIGLARALANAPFIHESLSPVQEHLIALMGELATAPEDAAKYLTQGYPTLTPDKTALLDGVIEQIESSGLAFSGWAVPGENVSAAALDVARTVCRRAERQVCVLHEAAQLGNSEIIVFLNRLSDLLWLLARWCENPPNGTNEG